MINWKINIAFLLIIVTSGCSKANDEKFFYFWVERNPRFYSGTYGLYFNPDNYCYPFSLNEYDRLISNAYMIDDLGCGDELECNRMTYRLKKDTIFIFYDHIINTYKFKSDDTLILYPIDEDSENDTFIRNIKTTERIRKEFRIE